MPGQQQAPSSAIDQLAAIRGGDTKSIMIRLKVALQKNPERIPVANKQIGTLVKMEHETAQLRKNIKQYQSNLAYAKGIIQTGITQLEKAMKERDPYDPNPDRLLEINKLLQTRVPTFTSLGKDVETLIQKRNELTQAVEAFTQEKDKLSQEIIEDIIANNPQKAKAKLEMLKVKQSTLEGQVDNLNTNESALQRKLDDLHVEIAHRAKISAGTSLEMPRQTGVGVERGMR